MFTQNNGNYILPFLCKFLGCLLHVACRILVSSPGRVAPLQWEHGVLTIELPSNFWKSQSALYLLKQYHAVIHHHLYWCSARILMLKNVHEAGSLKFEEYNSKKSYQVICTLTVIKITVPGVKPCLLPLSHFVTLRKRTTTPTDLSLLIYKMKKCQPHIIMEIRE